MNTKSPAQKCPRCGKDHTTVPADKQCQAAIKKAVSSPPLTQRPIGAMMPDEVDNAPGKSIYEQDADNRQNSLEGESLDRICQHAQRILDIDQELETLSMRLADLREEQLNIQTQLLPSEMESSGLSEFKLSSGHRISIKDVVQGSIPSESAIAKCKDVAEKSLLEDRRKACLEYLVKHGAEAIIAISIYAPLGKGQQKEAEKAVAALRKLQVEAHIEQNVHHQTLNSWLKEQLEQGKSVDADTFKLFTGKVAKVEQPKKK